MNNNQTPQQIKSDSKGKAIVSLVIGIINMVASSIWFLPSKSVLQVLLGTSEMLLFYFIVFIPITIVGLILGIIGLKSIKKIFAILGIILSAIALIILMFFLFIGLGFATM